MTTVAVRAEIAAFAASVRSHLDDLPADDVDELTDGLVADLTDQAAEAGDEFEVPDAAGYAAELRAAAGLPDRSDHPASSPTLRQRMRAADAALERWSLKKVDEVRRSRLGAWTIDTAIALRPVWWIARALVLFLILVPVLGITVDSNRGDLLDHILMLRHPAAWVLLGALLLLSLQWGRGRWAPVPWMRVVRNIVSLITAIIAPFVLTAAFLTISSIVDSTDVNSVESWTPGLSVDRERVRNIFAYDVDGNPIEHVQLFDQDGRPLTTVGWTGQSDVRDYYFYGGGGPTPVAEQEIGRQPVWNVFPLRELAPDAWGTQEPDVDDATAPTFPFPRVPSAGTPSTVDEIPKPDSADAATPAPSESSAP
jgi:hypothetical protein